ncbi:MAG TPA: hypothetical protein VGM73_01600 [Candidatus Didemnitutus sp.]|jgi:hypothetical protein
MNVSSSSPSSGINAQDLIALAQARLPTLASVLADDSDSSSPLGGSSDLSSLTGSSAQLQNQVTTLQSSGSQLDGVAELLQQMEQLAKQAAGGSNQAAAQQQFTALQQQLRTLVGGSSSVIGGSDVAGAGPFGPNADDSGNPANLQQGPMLSLIGQGADGSFSVDAADASSIVQATADQVARARASVGEQQVDLERQAILSQIGQQNLASAFSPLSSSTDAQQANQSALSSILSQGAGARAAQGSPSAAAALQLVQF